jgi:archaetidylinositol phosphate synthase
MLEEKRENFRKISEKIGNFFSKFGLTPNQYTLISLFFVLISFFSLINKNLIFAFIFFLIASLLDFIDGAVAKFLKIETKRGAYLDTICDRYVEAIILFGFLFLDLPDFIFPAKFWLFLALFGSLITTYSKSAAKEKELIKEELKKGFLGRAERIILISLAIFLGIFDFYLIIYPIVILAIFSNLTAFQRIYLSIKFTENSSLKTKK